MSWPRSLADWGQLTRSTHFLFSMRTAHLIAISKDGKRSLVETKSSAYLEVKTAADRLVKNPPAGVVAVEFWASDGGLKRTIKLPSK